MCGIAGGVALNKQVPVLVTTIKSMTDAIAHRGPDGEGHWSDDVGAVVLGHRRLSIIDLSCAGSQPMHYLDRYVIIFNGEIYNYVELREQCLKKGYSFQSHADTEVIMALYDWKGVHCLLEMDGMFTFCIWDKEKKELFCARDRFGEKPFYYAVNNNDVFLFASEMKALWAGGLPKKVDHTMVYNYLANSLVEDPSDSRVTFYNNIKKLAAAHYFIIKPGSRVIAQIRYWDINPANRNNDITREEAKQKLRELFFTSVSRRLRSDVPIGSSLSGGLDSSLVVCVIDQLNRDKKIAQKTFSAQFPGSVKDESNYQQLIVDSCKTDAHFVRPTAEMMLGDLQTVMHHQEEPFIHASICAQYEVFKLAKEANVTVLLDGQGADEILAGYHQFYDPYLNKLRTKDKKKYKEERQAYLELHADNDVNYQQGKNWKTLLKKIISSSMQSEIIQRTTDKVLLQKDFVSQFGKRRSKMTGFSNLQEALYYETFCAGLETLLRYADRNSMANSREVRLPFLSHELVEFLFTLPDDFKIRNGWTKWIMRTTFDDIVPTEIIWRKDKIGYEPPQQEWLRDDSFKKQISLSIESLADHNIINGRVKSDYKNSYFLWRILMTANTVFK